MVVLSGFLLPLLEEGRLPELEDYLKTDCPVVGRLRTDGYSTACCFESACKTGNHAAIDLMLRYGVDPTYPYLDAWKNAKDVSVLEKLLPATLPLVDNVLEYSRKDALDTMLGKSVELNAENIVNTLLENGAVFGQFDLLHAVDNNYTNLAKKILEKTPKLREDTVCQIIRQKNFELLTFCEEHKGIDLKNELFFLTSISSLEMFDFMLSKGNVITEEIIDRSRFYVPILENIFRRGLFPENLQVKCFLKTIGDFIDQCIDTEVLEIFIKHCKPNTTYGTALCLFIGGRWQDLVGKMIKNGEEILPGHVLLAKCLKVDLK